VLHEYDGVVDDDGLRVATPKGRGDELPAITTCWDDKAANNATKDDNSNFMFVIRIVPMYAEIVAVFD